MMDQNKQTYFVYQTPLGRITLASDGQALTHLVFGVADLAGTNKPTSLTNRASTEILEYLAGKRTKFDIPLNPQGSDFQRSVWNALLTIPYGQTRTYGEVAAMIGNPRSGRAVGGANNKNPIPLIIPCHRVIGVNGNLVGYAAGLHIKRFLLDLEAKYASK